MPRVAAPRPGPSREGQMLLVAVSASLLSPPASYAARAVQPSFRLRGPFSPPEESPRDSTGTTARRKVSKAGPQPSPQPPQPMPRRATLTTMMKQRPSRSPRTETSIPSTLPEKAKHHELGTGNDTHLVIFTSNTNPRTIMCSTSVNRSWDQRHGPVLRAARYSVWDYCPRGKERKKRLHVMRAVC